MTERQEKIEEVKALLLEIWHDSDEEGCNFTEKITTFLQGQVEQMVQEAIEDAKNKIIAKLEKKMEKIVAKQLAKLAAQAGVKSAWGVGTLFHTASSVYCAATGDYEGAIKEAVMTAGSTVPGVGTCLEAADFVVQTKQAYDEYTVSISSLI